MAVSKKSRKSSARATRSTATKKTPLTLAEARTLARSTAPGSARAKAATARAATTAPSSSPAKVGAERKRLAAEQRRVARQRTEEYRATLALLKQRGARKPGSPARGVRAARVVAAPLQILAEGDSWFDYPVPFFGGGIVARLADRLGVPILNLAKAGDEVRYMLGVAERKELITRLTRGCPAGGPWDVLLFSGGGNDIVDNPMALWIRDYQPGASAAGHIHQPRLDAALSLVRAGYEDLISLRDQLSPSTHLIFHTYDFAIPDGRGICHLGPWLKPTFDLRKFPSQARAFEVVKLMLKQFAALLQDLASANARVSVIDGQGTLAPQVGSWHNELHPTKAGFNRFADKFHQGLKAMFPERVF